MNKHEAAAYLGQHLRKDKKPISERTVERYAQKYSLTVTEVREEQGDGRRRPVTHYKDAEITALPDRIKAEIEKTGEQTHNPVALMQTDTSPAGLSSVAALAAAIAAALPAPAPLPAVPVADKLTLTLKDAAALAGLSQSYLRAAIRDGRLKADIRGRGWNVKRSDLDAFINKL